MTDAILRILLALLQHFLTKKVAKDEENKPIYDEPLVKDKPLEFEQRAAERRKELLKRIEEARE